MEGEITALEFQKKNKERVNLFIEGNFAFSISLNLALTLKKGQRLTAEQIVQLKSKAALDFAYQQALNHLGYRARSTSEVRDYLAQKGIPDQTINIVLERLAADHYLDDTAFSQSWVQHRSRSNPKGKQALRYELRHKGIAKEEIDQAITDLDEESLAWQAVSKKLFLWQSLDDLSLRKKISAHLARRGFGFDVIESILTKARLYIQEQSVIKQFSPENPQNLG